MTHKATLTLQTGDTDIAANDVLGQLHFQAPDEGAGTDAILVAAGIAAISEGDFSASNNATSLVFKTGASEAAAEKMRILSDGKVGIGETAPLGKLHVKSGDSGVSSPDITDLVVETASNGGISLLGATDGQVEIAFGDSGDANIGRIAYNNNGNYLATVVNAAEAMRIHSNSVVSFDDGIALGVGAGNNTAANVLDDYEEGTWTPTFNRSSSQITIAILRANYTKIGRLVHVTVHAVNNDGAKNNAYIIGDGLPFTSASINVTGIGGTFAFHPGSGNSNADVGAAGSWTQDNDWYMVPSHNGTNGYRYLYDWANGHYMEAAFWYYAA